ncbi:inovirus Gp2 family protein [Comamonas humi]
MKRNPLNTNQQIHQEAHFQGAPVITHHGYLIGNHLQRMHDCLERSLDRHSRICLMRFDLYVPDNVSIAALGSNAIVSKFFAALRAKITQAQNQGRSAGHRVHEADVRYMWCREIGSHGRVHYHVALLVNHAAYAFIGQFNLDGGNMYARIHEAWACALNMYAYDIAGYVHIPTRPTYRIVRGDEASFNAAFYRVSYFSKLNTKEFQQGFHTFGCSRS